MRLEAEKRSLGFELQSIRDEIKSLKDENFGLKKELTELQNETKSTKQNFFKRLKIEFFTILLYIKEIQKNNLINGTNGTNGVHATSNGNTESRLSVVTTAVPTTNKNTNNRVGI